MWISSQVGIPGNERTDRKAKKGANSSRPEVLLTHKRAKSIISAFIVKYTAVTPNTKSLGKPWYTLTTVSSIPRHLLRVEAVAHFRLTIEHDFWEVYPHWLGVATVFDFPLCDDDIMDGDQPLQCNGLPVT
ncbi:uncharacterized protein TNCV_1594871 [Trichonephila clavipes]|nr:uncharacterized protein TNCV_1594871 [Trichonephila clavipes]